VEMTATAPYAFTTGLAGKGFHEEFDALSVRLVPAEDLPPSGSGDASEEAGRLPLLMEFLR